MPLLSIDSGADAQCGAMECRIAELYDAVDAERREWLNAIVAREYKRKKYVYKREHDALPGERCKICGKSRGRCRKAIPLKP